MMPKINRLTGRFFTVLISLTVAVFLPRAVMAGEATPRPPLASPAGVGVVPGLRLNLLAAPLAGGSKQAPSPTLCQISDTVYRADGTPAQGTVLLTWQGFTTAAGQAVTPGSLLVTLDASGGFNASVAPNTGASPAGTYYKAIFKLDDGTTETEFWVVPNTQTTTIGAIRSKLVPANQAAQFLTRDFADSNYVNLASTQNISGVKTFSVSPAVPSPQNPTDAANKAYVDATAVSNLASPPPIGSGTPNTVNATTLTATDSRTSVFPYVDIRANGGIGDGQRTGPNCSMTQGSHALTCAGTPAPFAASDVGKAISVEAAGAAGCGAHGVCNLVTTITGYTNGNTITLAAAALSTESSAFVVWGTDNKIPNQNATDLAASPGTLNHAVYFPHVLGQNPAVPGAFTGCYVTTGTIQLPSSRGANKTLTLYGDGYLASAICQLTIGAPVIADTFIHQGHSGNIIEGLGFLGLPDYADAMGTAIQCNSCVTDVIGPNNWFNGWTEALYLNQGAEVTFTGNVVEESIHAIYGRGQSGAAISMLTITQNIFAVMYNGTGYVLDLQYASGIQEGYNQYGPDIGLGIKCDYCTSFNFGNDDYSTAYVDGGAWGNQQFALTNSANGVVHDNTFNNQFFYTVYVGGNDADVIFHDNTITAPTNYNAILFGGTGNSVTIKNNRILRSASSGGIQLDGGAILAGTVISENTCASSITTCVQRVGSPVPSGAYVALNSGDAAVNALSAQQVNVAGDLTARDIPGVEYHVSKYASIQAAINAAYNNGSVLGTVVDDRTAPYSGPGFILYDSVTLKLAATTYTITSTVTYNNGNNNVTAGIIAVPGAKLIGASTSTNHGTIITAGNGLNADLIATSTVGTGIAAAAQWWHWGGFENLRVIGNGANQTAGNCFNIENMGETAFVRSIEVSGCYLDNILFTGASATPSDIANITTNSAGRYGFNFNNLAGVAVVHGLSGDSNATSIIRLNGGQSGTLTILGLKTEEEISGQDPLITIDETGQNGAQPSLFIVGGYTFGRNGVNDVIKYVNGTLGTTPYISVSNFYVQNYANAVNDVVNSRTTAATNMNKVPFYFGPTGAFFSGQAFTLDLNTFVQSPHSGNYVLTEVFGTTSSNETIVAASGTSTTLSTGGIGFRMPNRTTYGQTPELFAKMTYAFPGGVPNTQQWEFIPAKVNGDTSTRWIGDPSYRWDEIYSADVNSTTATVGTLNVTTCNGCSSGTQQVNSDWNAGSGVAQILNKPALATVATSGSYNDLSNKPAAPSQQVNSDWNAGSGVAQILNKPALATVATSGSYNDLSNKPVIPTSSSWPNAGSCPANQYQTADTNGSGPTCAQVQYSQLGGTPTTSHLVAGSMQGNSATLTGNSADQTLYTATLPAGTFAVGTGAHCWAKWTHPTTGSTAITYKWTLGSATVAYAAFTSASVNVTSDVEVLTPAALTSQIINVSPAIAGTAFQAGPSNGNAGSENLANADTIKLTFNAGSGEQVKGVSFYCQTVQ